MPLGAAHEVALGAVLVLAVGVLVLFGFLLLQREIGTLIARHRTRREAELTPLVHQALSDPSAVRRLRAALRPFDRAVIREVLLHLALDLRGEEASRIARLFRDVGLLEVELTRLRSRRRRRRAVAAENLGTLRVPGTFRALLPALADRDVHVRIAVVRALGDLRTPEALSALVLMLGDPSPSVSRQAQDILAKRGRTVAREIRAYVRRSGNPGDAWPPWSCSAGIGRRRRPRSSSSSCRRTTPRCA